MGKKSKNKLLTKKYITTLQLLVILESRGSEELQKKY